MENNELQTVPYQVSTTLIGKFLDNQDVCPGTKYSYKKKLEKFFDFCGMSTISKETILEYKQSLVASGTGASAGSQIVPIRQFFKWASEEGICPDYASHIKPPKREDGFRKDALTTDQTVKIISGVTDTRDRAILLLMVHTGLRVNEVVNIKMDDIRQSAGYNLLYVLGKGRTTKNEFVVLVPTVMDAIHAYLQEQNNQLPGAYLFQSKSNNNKGKKMTTRGLSGLVKQYFISAGYKLPTLTAHSLRHTAATLALGAGADIYQVSQMLRHRSVNVTMAYVHNQQRLSNNAESFITIDGGTR